MADLKRNVRVREGESLNNLHDMPHLGGIGAQELEARRRVIEQVANGDFGPWRTGGVADQRRASALYLHTGSTDRAAWFGEQREPANRGDRRKRLAPKAERRDGE